ncbi:hypothetical protein V6957_004955 [Vibrio parahaemolyticus]|nr:hypothetical protein [Vibrio parahaemolyticus]EGQ8991604.1 hypothetical protein [Vibrio parahaemolyticus]EGQ9006116.1 hypothetical protein [Vibrio parahaemolyticus]EGR2870240.1 hypothetical protein [Vibrio parahaemolyticus]EGR2899916.1 hypothetical protein [Vibrio parahaemolyticus]
MEIEDLEIINKVALTWFNLLFNRKEIHEQKKNLAIKSLMESLSLTAQYMQSLLDDPDSQSRDTERGLSQKWSDTSILVKPYDADLAERCFFKGVYWSNRNRFTEAEIIEKRMKLHHVESDVSKALKSI